MALEVKLLLRTSKQRGGSGARHQGLRRAVALLARVEHAGVGIRSVIALCLWPPGEWVSCVCYKGGSEAESLQGLEQEAGVLRR